MMPRTTDHDPSPVLRQIRQLIPPHFLAIVVCLATCVAAGGELPTTLDQAQWIWGNVNSDICECRMEFTLDKVPAAATILITADNGYELYINGAPVGYDVGADGSIWGSVERYDVTSKLAAGHNVLGIRGICLGGSRGVIASLWIQCEGAEPRRIDTDGTWRVSIEGNPSEYAHPEYVEGPEWQDAMPLGPMGMAPWGKLEFTGSVGGRRSGALPGSVALAKPAADFCWPEGVAFLADDCSVYVPERGDAWGVCFRVGSWSRAYTEFDIPCPSKIGRKLMMLAPTGPEATPRLLLDAGRGAMGSPSVSYDGRSILVAMAAEGDSFFHIYRVPIDGGAPIQLTDGPFHDIDPAELPGGEIVFTSTRIGSFEEYHNPPSRALFTMHGDGSNIRALTYTPIFDNEPKVMADGRIAFVRTDNFFDRAKVETQIHVIRPDGSGGQTEVGADVGADYGVRLRALGYGSPAPLPDGRLACISSQGNFICTPGSPESEFHRLPDGLGDLAALPDGRLLATVLRPKALQVQSDVLAVIDPADNQVVSIYQSPAGSIHSPVFVGPRERPPTLSQHTQTASTDEPGATGFLFCQNVRFTRKEKADWDRIRAIRVIGARALTTRSSHSHIVHAGHETVELGTVPIAPDGSFSVEVPADLPIALQAVDAEGRAELNEMSWIYVRPGEKRSCLGCHHPRQGAPSDQSTVPLALQSEPVKLSGQGDPHRFRGNNSGVTGMMDLQFERFRETASLNLISDGGDSPAPGRQEVTQLIAQLASSDTGLRISAAQRLALFRDRDAAPALGHRLSDSDREVRVAAALALAACGTRDSVPQLLRALRNRDAVVAQAAAVALENLTAHAEPFQPFTAIGQRRVQADAWRTWFDAHPWDRIEQELIRHLSSPDRVQRHRAIVALGHIGDQNACAALRQFVAQQRATNPYEPFENDNRTDRFTFDADSPLNPRMLQEAVRALGYQRDTESIALLSTILQENLTPRTGNLYLAEAAVESLGRIGTPEAETILITAFGQLPDYVHYVGWYSDHPALYACHASPLHARIIMALDQLGSTQTGPIVPALIRSLPTDPDRALFVYNDTYETLVGRVIRRSARAEQTVETCLALLGDPQAQAEEELRQAISSVHAAWAGTPAADNRAAQLLSLLCRDDRCEGQVRAAYERYRAQPEDPIDRPLGNPTWIPQRHWVLFYLGRALGQLRSPESIDTLLASLTAELNEARHGRPDPAEPNIHFLQLEYTPCWRATAAWALGTIGDRRAVPRLLEVVQNLDNATDTRHAAATALGAIADPDSLEAIQQLASDYPEVSTRRSLQQAVLRCQQAAREQADETAAMRP